MVMPHMGPLEVGLILTVILIVFGGGKLPQVGGAVGKGLRAFRKGQSGEEEEAIQEPRKKTTKRITRSGTKRKASSVGSKTVSK